LGVKKYQKASNTINPGFFNIFFLASCGVGYNFAKKKDRNYALRPAQGDKRI
jgi:hypothetical protein